MRRTNRQPVECEAGCELLENTVLLFSWIRMIPVGSAIAAFAMIGVAGAQVRGVYPLGMSATNPGVTPEPGFTYSNQFLFYSRSELKDANGAVTATGQNSLIMPLQLLFCLCCLRFGLPKNSSFASLRSCSKNVVPLA